VQLGVRGGDRADKRKFLKSAEGAKQHQSQNQHQSLRFLPGNVGPTARGAIGVSRRREPNGAERRGRERFYEGGQEKRVPRREGGRLRRTE